MHDNEYEALLRAVATVTWRASAEGESYDLDSWCRFTGQTLDQARGRGWLAAVHPDDRALVEQVWAEARTNQSLYRVEYRIRGADGRYRWFDVWGAPLRDDSGRLLEWFGACIDIQERVAAQEQLRSVMDNISDAFVAIDPDWRILFQNREGARINGKQPEEIYGKRLYEEWPEVLGTALERNYRLAIAEDRPIRFEHRYHDPGKYDVWLDVQAVPSGDGGLGIFYLDITERKRAEAALAESERRFRSFAEHVSAAFLVTEGAFRTIEYASPFVEVLWGHGEPALRAEPELLLAGVHPDDREAVRRTLGACTAGECGLDHRVIAADGSERWVSHTVTPLPPAAGDGRPRLAHVVLDISERKRLERRLAVAQRMESLGHLSGGVAHDFNNVLTVVHGRVALLQALAEERNDALLARELAEIEEAAARVSGIVEQVLTFARRQDGEPRPIDLNRQIQGSAALFRGLVGEGVELVALLEDDLPPVLADPAQLDQVLVNLVVNATEAMGGQGRLTLRTATWELDRDDPAQGLAAGTYVRLTVTDTGRGIAPEVLDQVFDPFFTTRAAEGGTGLGLSTCYGVVAAAGGRIAVRSEPGVGTEFRILLPAVAGPASVDLGPRPAEDLRGDESLLIAEDEPRLRALLVDVLSGLGYRVRAAGSGDEALALLRDSGPLDLLVTDMVMPGMTGARLADAAREARPGLPVLTISGYRREHRVAPGPLPPELAFLSKPFTPHRLAERVRAVLDRAGGSDPSAPVTRDAGR